MVSFVLDFLFLFLLNLEKENKTGGNRQPTFGFIFYVFYLDSAVAHPALRRTNSNFCLLKNPNTSFSK